MNDELRKDLNIEFARHKMLGHVQLIENIEQLVTAHTDKAVKAALIDFRKEWHTLLRQEVHQDLNDRIKELQEGEE